MRLPKRVRQLLKDTNPEPELPDLPRTDWFSRDILPVRKGVYEIECPHEGMDVTYSYWNGKWWSIWTYSFKSLAKLKHVEDVYDVTSRWRGLTKRFK